MVIDTFNLLQERLHLGLTVKEAAQGMGVPAALLNAWETGEVEPLGSHLVIMSRFYGCSPDYLLGLAADRMAGLGGT